MRTTIINSIVKLVFWTFCMLIIIPTVNADDDKYKARISVDFTSIMADRDFLAINVKYKGDDGYQPGTNLSLNVYEQLEDTLIFKGKTTTNAKGNAEFDIVIPSHLKDSIIKFEYVVAIEDDPNFLDADKSVKFSTCKLLAEALVIDSLNYVTAVLTDAMGEPIEGEKLKLQLQRLFAPLTIGESSYETDDDGKIEIELTDTMPGIDGILTFQVTMDSRKYGIVKNIFEAPIGKVIVDKSTFNDRTMWSPPNKTPIFLLIFPNLIILGIWFVIGLLVFNLIKIYKS